MQILTQRIDAGRTGVNHSEIALNPGNVNVNTFGRLFKTRVVQAGIYAQPLYVPQLDFGARGTFDTVFIASMDNRVTAIDANSGNIIVQNQIDPNPVNSHGNSKAGYQDIVGGNPTIGILSTPAIDLAAGKMYLVLFSGPNHGGSSTNPADFKYVLHAVDLTTLQSSRSAIIGGSVPGTGYSGSKTPGNKFTRRGGDIVVENDRNIAIIDATGIGTHNPRVQFNAMMQLQRPALLLLKGIIYIAFGSRGDFDPWHGWVFAYDAITFNQLDLLCTTPNGARGGIWQAGQGLLADTNGFIYGGTGNGDSDPADGGPPGTPNIGESFIKVRLEAGKFKIVGWYNAFDDIGYAAPVDPNPDVGARDDDLGASAPALLPDGRIVGGGKDGYFYLIDTDKLIGDAAARQRALHPDDVVLQYFLASFNFTRGTRPVPTFLGLPISQPNATHHIHGAPVPWQNGANTAMVYVWGENDVVRAYDYSLRTPGQPSSGGFPSELPISGIPIDTADFQHVLPRQGNETARGMITASNETITRDGMPGGFSSLSWDGQNPSTAILWCTFPPFHNGNRFVVGGELAAFDASTFDHQIGFSRITLLWRSRQDPDADFGDLPKFCCPTVADGKVFQVSGDGMLFIYGLRPAPGGGYNLSRDVATPSFGGASGLTLNGSASVGAPVEGKCPIELTQNPHGPNIPNNFAGFPVALIPSFHAGSVFCTQPIDVTNLQTRFTVQLIGLDKNNMADGFTFTIQAIGPQALGSWGSGLGYAVDPMDGTNTSASIPRSVALAFSVVTNTVSFWRDGSISTTAASQIVNLGTHSNNPIALNSGNRLLVTIDYSTATKILTLTVDDLDNNNNSTGPIQIPNIDIPGFLNLGNPAMAHIGFTGGTGAKSAQQLILDWSVP